MKSLLFHGRGWLLAVVGTLLVAGAAHASTFVIFNTGVDGSGTPLFDATAPGATPDTHYTLVAIPGDLVTVRPVQVATSFRGFPIPPWIGDNSTSAWIGPNPDTQLIGPTGNYDYRTTFNLTGFDFNTAVITGKWATDNSGSDILLNGGSTGIPNTTGFGTFSPTFTISSGFVAGLNTLDFLVNNGGSTANPTGLRVEMTGTATAIPEPASLFLIGTGLVAFGIFRRRRA